MLPCHSFCIEILFPTRIYCSSQVLYYSLDPRTAFHEKYRQSAYTAIVCIRQSRHKTVALSGLLFILPCQLFGLILSRRSFTAYVFWLCPHQQWPVSVFVEIILLIRQMQSLWFLFQCFIELSNSKCIMERKQLTTLIDKMYNVVFAPALRFLSFNMRHMGTFFCLQRLLFIILLLTSHLEPRTVYLICW